MCRYDDGDYEWYVDATFRDVVPDGETLRCEDCGRTVESGETIVRYTCQPGSEWDDERPFVFAAYDLTGKVAFNSAPRRYAFESDPYFVIVGDELGDDDSDLEARIDAFDALGFVVDEVRDPRLPFDAVPDHYHCVQCKAAERWLNEVCDQNVVLVTKYDLIDHLNDYDAETLGSDFVTLTKMVEANWRHPHFHRIIPEPIVARITDRAIKHAQLVGLHPD